MRLADFIQSNIEPILVEWEAFARSMTGATTMDTLTLRDHASDILHATVRDMQAPRSQIERSAQSIALRVADNNHQTLEGASEQHAVGRLGSGFNLMKVVSEYRALRASVLQLWHDSGPRTHETDLQDVARFNESIDQSLAKAVSSYTQRVDQSRDLFLAILSHDLRSPLNSISISTGLLPQPGHPDHDAVGAASQIATSANVMGRMISDLLDYARTRLGAGMPVSPVPMDAGVLCRALFNEFHAAHPTREIRFLAEGDLNGNWDEDRLRQAVSNLLGNALQHSPDDAIVELRLKGEPDDISIVVYNTGPPIPPAS